MVGHKIQGCRAAIGFDGIMVASCRVLCLGICNKMKSATCYRTKLCCMRVCGESLHRTNVKKGPLSADRDRDRGQLAEIRPLGMPSPEERTGR